MREQIQAEFPALGVQIVEGQYVPTGTFSGIPYTRVEATGSTLAAFCMEQTIDLNGLMLEEDTVVIPKAYAIQDPGIYTCQTDDNQYTGLAGSLWAVEIMSTRKLYFQTVVDDIVIRGNLPGYHLSVYDKQQIIMGEYRLMLPTLPTYDPLTIALSNTPGAQYLNRQSTFGYTAKIANPRVFCYRILIPYMSIDFPAASFSPPYGS